MQFYSGSERHIVLQWRPRRLGPCCERRQGDAVESILDRKPQAKDTDSARDVPLQRGSAQCVLGKTHRTRYGVVRRSSHVYQDWPRSQPQSHPADPLSPYQPNTERGEDCPLIRSRPRAVAETDPAREIEPNVRKGPHRDVDAKDHSGVVSSISMGREVSSWPGDGNGAFELLNGRKQIPAHDRHVDLLRPRECGREQDRQKQGRS
jgi:hypothetical protein